MRAYEYQHGLAYYDEQGQLIWKRPGSRVVHWCFIDDVRALREMREQFPLVFISPLYLRLKHEV